MLRIRDNEATIRQLKFPENTLENLRTNDLEPENSSKCITSGADRN